MTSAFGLLYTKSATEDPCNGAHLPDTQIPSQVTGSGKHLGVNAKARHSPLQYGNHVIRHRSIDSIHRQFTHAHQMWGAHQVGMFEDTMRAIRRLGGEYI